MIVALSAGRDAPFEMRSRLALKDEAQRMLLTSPRPGVGEIAVVSTCHRTEIYATGDGLDADVVHAVAALMPGLLPTDHHDMRFMNGAEAIEHLFRVACGLDSLVIGEPQVLGQIRRSYAMASETGAAGPVLSNVFGRAIRLGKRVRAETAIGRLGQSVGTIAADYLDARFEGLSGRKALIVGAGEAASDAAKALWKAGAEINVASRMVSSAKRLAAEVDGSGWPLENLQELLTSAEFAIIAVSGGVVLNGANLPAPGANPALVVLDLSVPPAISIDGRADVEVRTLEEIPGPRGPEVIDAVIDAEAMVKKEVADLQQWADTRASGPAVKDLKEFTEDLVREELERYLPGLGLSEEQHQRLEALTQRIANKLMHGPITELRRADEPTRSMIRKIFHLE